MKHSATSRALRMAAEEVKGSNPRLAAAVEGLTTFRPDFVERIDNILTKGTNKPGLYHSRPGEEGTTFEVTRARKILHSMKRVYTNLSWSLEALPGGSRVRVEDDNGNVQYLVERGPHDPVPQPAG